MEEIEIEELEQPSIPEIFNGSKCPKCGSDHTYAFESDHPYSNRRTDAGAVTGWISCHGCNHEWSLVEELGGDKIRLS